jgi:MFS family permease
MLKSSSKIYKKMNKALQSDSFLPWFVVLVASLFFFYEFIQMNMFNSLAQSFEKTFVLSTFQVGIVSGFYFLSDSILLYPAGFILDRFSSRRLLILGMLMCIFGTLCISSATNSWILVLARLLSGSASAFCLLSILRLAAQWFPVERMGTVSGIVVTIGMFGGAISQTPLTLLIDHYQWREALTMVAGLGFLMLLLIFLVVRDAPPKYRYAHLQNERGVKPYGMWESLKEITKNKVNWLIGLYICTMNLPIMILAGLFGTQYMTQVRGFNNVESSSISMMIFIGTIVGSTLFGILSDLIGSRRKPMLITAIFSLILFLFILYLPSLSYLSYLVLFFLLGFITAAQVIGYPATQESNPEVMVGSALGFISVLIMGLPGLLQPLVGFLMSYGWDGHMKSGVPVYSMHAYNLGLWVLVVGFLISIFCAWAMPETFGKHRKGKK